MFEIPDNVPTRITDICGSNSECIYDYLVTNNEQFGQLSANSSVIFDDILGLTAPVVTCGFPSDTSNAEWHANGYTEGSIALLNCTKGYYPVDVNIKCLPSGNWSSVKVSCIPFPDCGGPSPVANGLWVPNEGTNGKRATLRCKNGVYGEEIEISCTDNGTWTEFVGLCLPAQTLASTSDSKSGMSTATVTMTLSTKTLTGDEIVQSSPRVHTSIRTRRQNSTQRSSQQNLSSTPSSTTPSSETTSPGTVTQTTAAITSTVHNQQEISQTSASSSLQTTSNMPQSQFVSVESTLSLEIKSTQDSVLENGQTSQAIDGSTTRKLSSTLKSSNTNESTDTDNFTIAVSVTISVVCLVIVITVIAIALAKISKKRKEGSKRYEIRKSYDEDRSSTNSDPSSLYNVQIRRPLYGQKWPHQQPNHLH
ncbi:uncharacterized protein LOC127714270 [Mytilus californianus]|uniref:uncharacterized protein LOC127714270 n=1 Tax=Mytilus californianus TaxID=6549 RepID=UPI002246D25A|nr:uncharacterized protein LOC127714270 [Mytilus californianus]